nr:hypothetical protein [uncultured Oribacterium sp.]
MGQEKKEFNEQENHGHVHGQGHSHEHSHEHKHEPEESQGHVISIITLISMSTAMNIVMSTATSMDRGRLWPISIATETL